MSRTSPLLEVKGISCGYLGEPVCGTVTFTLHPGEVLGVVGLNGTGKSTVLRTIAGRQDPMDGTVRFKGAERVEASAAWRRAVAAVLDDDAWFPGLTAKEHLELVAAGHSMPSPVEVVERELDFFGLTHRAHAYPEALSSGQRRRLLLAAAFLRPSELVMLDEPEQRLDPVMTVDLGQRLSQHVQSGAAAVVVTHDPDLLIQVTDRCLVIDDDVRTAPAAEAAALIRGQGR